MRMETIVCRRSVCCFWLQIILIGVVGLSAAMPASSQSAGGNGAAVNPPKQSFQPQPAKLAGDPGLDGAPGSGVGRVLVRTGHLLDVTTGAEPAGQTIVVVGDKISAIAATASTPAAPGDREIDLRRSGCCRG
jgi:hypothetical protein